MCKVVGSFPSASRLLGQRCWTWDFSKGSAWVVYSPHPSKAPSATNAELVWCSAVLLEMYLNMSEMLSFYKRSFSYSSSKLKQSVISDTIHTGTAINTTHLHGDLSDTFLILCPAVFEIAPIEN